MSVRCAACEQIVHTTADLGLDDAGQRRVSLELVRTVGPVVVIGRLDEPLDLVASPLNELGIPCPGCQAARWSDYRSPTP